MVTAKVSKKINIAKDTRIVALKCFAKLPQNGHLKASAPSTYKCTKSVKRTTNAQMTISAGTRTQKGRSIACQSTLEKWTINLVGVGLMKMTKLQMKKII